MEPKIDPAILEAFRDRHRPGDALLDVGTATQRSLSRPAWIVFSILAVGMIYAVAHDWLLAVWWWVISGRF